MLVEKVRFRDRVREGLRKGEGKKKRETGADTQLPVPACSQAEDVNPVRLVPNASIVFPVCIQTVSL